MSLPEPHPGLVISYAYLWSHEQETGLREGRKDRPCAIVVARRSVRNRTVVAVAPISHAALIDKSAAIEIPAELKRHLKLDATRSWIVLTEVNEFLWPGPDLRPISPRRPKEFAFGVLPPGFFRQVRDRLLMLVRERNIRRISRTE